MGCAVEKERLYAAIDATWAPLEMRSVDGWILRCGGGGGQRVSAATALTEGADIGFAEAEMRAMGQVPLFMIRDGEDSLDAALAEQGYRLKDPVAIRTLPTADLAKLAPPGGMFFEGKRPLAIQNEMWAAGGIGPTRLDVMARVKAEKRYLLGRVQDTPAATAFLGLHAGIAMLHGLEVVASQRGKGVGTAMMGGAARFAEAHGADTLAVLVVRENDAGEALYSKLGMVEKAGYHYRVFPD